MIVVGGLGLAAACGGKGGGSQPEAPKVPPVTLTGQSDEASLKSFCDKSWPGTGPAGQPFGAGPALHAGAKVVPAPTQKGWRWLSFWATWCAPCMEEMPMLAKWRDALQKEGMPFQLELWSVDEDETKLKAKEPELPAPMTWVQSPEALATYLGNIGMNPDSMLPVQMLIDQNDQLRCVRVGAVHENDWGTVKSIIR